ncbi:CDP-alcohol phosphatidyltransferase-like enzyme [Panacagrimonas perspica]|uniref:CDP-alcohol phosphatidyltransferase-like enzyme n=1 Tax=Panacagrimonas perspica TaxID=381431 RepID=A0A4R7P6L9_9GAMM|nr:CDP-alcohol phosphatidyltransferase family protein [Panacagrimonas perspica]TDU28941.1 CDP-alcohol phosphatidyltransferase-like enzyme [Panacagrimonas perspica]THD02239.1 hypothetical protein B1810_15010 [Panacagrimonas perspica]
MTNLWIDTSGLARAQKLFGLPPLERLRRSVGAFGEGDVVTLSGPPAGAAWPGARLDSATASLGQRLRGALSGLAGKLVVVDGTNVIDPRLIRFLGENSATGLAARGDGARRAVAMCLDASLADAIPESAANLREVADALLAAGRIAPLDERRFPAYIDKLRRTLPYWIHAVDGVAARRELERQMFWENYKGSTDLLTRWVFPPLVWQLTRLSTFLGIRPNAITALSVVLAFVAVPLWADGQWLAGFACAYAMAVLDSVDGKVARVTLTSSWIGNVMDHGLDIVHPPFWYFAWAWGLGARPPDDPLYVAALAFIAFYVADRLVLGVARHRLGHALHSTTTLDEKVRSVIARRNITMSIMAIALVLGQGAAGFLIVTAWQGLTLAWHGWRTIWLGFLTSEYRGKEK